jgi:Rho GDP-dissociation inhibitor
LNSGKKPKLKKVIVNALVLEVANRPDVTIDLSTPEALLKLKDQTLTIKEGAEYRLKVVFRYYLY